MKQQDSAAHQAPFRCGFAALIGQPNVGKSTLLNHLLGSKVAIVTPKPQTTRTRIQGILNRPDSQIILVDTPGFCAEKSRITKVLRRTAGTAAADADVTVLMLEAKGCLPEFSDEQHAIFKTLAHKQVVVALNKIDALERPDVLLPWMQMLQAQFPKADIIPISARYNDGTQALLDAVIKRLPEGPALYPDDMYTDQAERMICAEMVREQLLLQTQQEVPHSTAVVIDAFEDGRAQDEPMCRLVGRIFVERDSQKPIVIGRGGHQIKAIGQAARKQIERFLGCRIFLGLTVHVDKQWTQHDQGLRRYGLNTGTGAPS